MTILGVTDKNDKNEIKKKYHILIKIYHPDRPGGNTEKFKEINKAYTLLMGRSRFGMRFGKGKISLISIKETNNIIPAFDKCSGNDCSGWLRMRSMVLPPTDCWSSADNFRWMRSP